MTCRDDIDAYILQVEGVKRWKVHAPTSPEHVLPRWVGSLCRGRFAIPPPTLPLLLLLLLSLIAAQPRTHALPSRPPTLVCLHSSGHTALIGESVIAASPSSTHPPTPSHPFRPLSCRYSSRDFEDSEVGPCVLEVELHPGDLLYLPRGSGELPGSCRGCGDAW